MIGKFLIIFIIFKLSFQQQEQQEQVQTPYKYLQYSQILQIFEDLQAKYPNYIKTNELRKESQLQDLKETNCEGKNCDHIYAEITNFQNSDYKSVPQVVLIGGFHGDEALGPNIITYFAQYLLENAESDQFQEILNNKMLVLLPMANPSGYSANRREEQHMKGGSIDINRDFPYNNTPDQCFQTSGARLINFLFKKYLFQNGITFHGGMYAIGYPWGSENHLIPNKRRGQNGEFAPDHEALKTIGNYMAIKSPKNDDLNIPTYPVNTLTNGIYAVPGTLEDWAYAASWESELTQDESLLSKCTGISDEEMQIPQNSVKSLFYLIEASDPKKPKEIQLGNWEANQSPTSKGYGHISRNIDACLAIIESVTPVAQINAKNLGGFKLKLQWKMLGCQNVDSTKLYYRKYSDQNSVQINQFNGIYDIENYMQYDDDEQQGQGHIQNQEHQFEKTLEFDEETLLDILIVSQCDAQYGQQKDPKPNVTAQSHLVRSRLEENYKVQNDDGYSINSKYYAYDLKTPIYKVTQIADQDQNDTDTEIQQQENDQEQSENNESQDQKESEQIQENDGEQQNKDQQQQNDDEQQENQQSQDNDGEQQENDQSTGKNEEKQQENENQQQENDEQQSENEEQQSENDEQYQNEDQQSENEDHNRDIDGKYNQDQNSESDGKSENEQLDQFNGDQQNDNQDDDNVNKSNNTNKLGDNIQEKDDSDINNQKQENKQNIKNDKNSIVKRDNGGISTGLWIVLILVLVILVITIVLLLKRFLRDDENLSVQAFEQMDRKFGNNQREKLQIDVGISNTEAINSDGEEKVANKSINNNDQQQDEDYDDEDEEEQNDIQHVIE